MKTPRLVLTIALAAASFILTAHAQTWQTSDTVVFPAAGPSGQVDDIAAAPDGTLYAIGAALSASGSFEANWLRRSSDAGVTWQSVASFSPVTGNGINKLAVDSSGRLYAAGLFNNVWTVFRSVDQGTTWSTVDSFSTAGTYPELRDITTDANGAVYVVGSATPSRGPAQWLVRKGVPNGGGLAWTTIDTYTADRTYGARAASIAVASSITGTEIFVAGSVHSSSGPNWLVRRSTDGGASWSVSDRFTSGIDGAQTIALALDGTIYTSGRLRTVGGTKKNPTSVTSFVVRKGVPNAGTMAWSTQQIMPETTSASEFRPQSSVVDSFGRIFFGGYDVTRPDNISNYRVKVSVDGGQTLLETENFVGVAFALAFDPAGNVFSGGYFGDSIANGGGIIRKLAVPTP